MGKLKKPEPEIAQPLPQNPEAERTVLGAILVDNTMLDIALEKLKPEHFFQDGHTRIFKRMVEMQEQRRAIDILTLVNALRQSGELEAVGGAGYVSALEDGIPKITNVSHYAGIVLDKYALRSVIHILHLTTQRAFEQDEPSSVMESCMNAISELSLETAPQNDGVTERDAAMEMISSLEKKDVMRAYSGVTELDEWTGGALPGELWDIVAGTGVGKTIFARQVSARTCKSGYHTLYASGEMFAPHLVSKRVFPDAGVSPIKFRFPEKITETEYKALVRAAGEQCQQCRILDGELTLSRIRTAARQMARTSKLGLVVGDYDQLISAPGKDPLERQISLTRGMKRIAMEHECPTIMISQLRKLLEQGKIPTLDDLYGSKTASAHPSAVLYVHREYVERLKGDETSAEIIVMKFRDGRIGKIRAVFNVPKLRFDDAPPSEADSLPDKPARRANHSDAQKELL